MRIQSQDPELRDLELRPWRFLRGGGMRQIEYDATREAVARERAHWLPILQYWWEEEIGDLDPAERRALYRQLCRLRRILGLKPPSAPDAVERRRQKTRARVQRYRQRQRAAELR